MLKSLRAALCAAAFIIPSGILPRAALAQDAGSYGPGAPVAIDASARRVVRSGPIAPQLTLAQALEEAEARSPDLTAAEADLEAARGRLRQAGLRPNPELGITVENFAGTGAYSGFNGAETTFTLNQRIDIGGRRAARVSAAETALAIQALRFSIARADLARAVRSAFGIALAQQARLELAQSNLKRAQELARVSDELVAAGREPPLRAFRARAAATAAEATLREAEANDRAALRSLSALFGEVTPLTGVTGAIDRSTPEIGAPAQALDVRLAEAELRGAEAGLKVETAARRLDPVVGVGMRRLEDNGDRAFLASVTMPIQLFDRNQGNIAAARSAIRAAEARRNAAIVEVSARIANAETALNAARARVTELETTGVPAAEEAARLSDLAYRAGRIALIELLDAQTAFADAQSQLIDAHLALVEARTTLMRASAQ